jgi:hypothetical protein
VRCTTRRAKCGRPDYTVIFGVSRALGVLSQLTLSRALGRGLKSSAFQPTYALFVYYSRPLFGLT